MTIPVELPKLLGSPTTSYSTTAAGRKGFQSGAQFQNASNCTHSPRPDDSTRGDRLASRRNSITSIGTASSLDSLDRRMAALRRPTDATVSDDGTTSRHSTSSGSIHSAHVSYVQTDRGALHDRSNVPGARGRLLELPVSGRPLGLLVEIPMLGLGHGASEPGARGMATDNASQASRTHGGVFARLQSMFQGIYNRIRHGVEHKAGTGVAHASLTTRESKSVQTDALRTPSGDWRDRLAAAVPTLEYILASPHTRADVATFQTAFLNLRIGLTELSKLAQTALPQNAVSVGVARELEALASRANPVANGETATELWNRFKGGDDGALSNPRTRSELAAYVADAKNAVWEYTFDTDNRELALRLKAWGTPPEA